MTALQIEDIRQFTTHLFLKESFDYFLLVEANFQTLITATVDGRLHEDFFSSEEKENLRDRYFADWASVRPLCFSLIKGKKLPLSFRIVLKFSDNNVQKLLAGLPGGHTPEDVTGFYLNIRYENQQLFIVTGASLKTFTPDRSLEQLWDMTAKRILSHNGIIFREK